MKTVSMTGDPTAVPCFRNAHRVVRLEAGTRIVEGITSAYCAMTYTTDDGPAKIIGEAGDNWDRLLNRLKADEPNVAHWLLGRLPALNDPFETIGKLVARHVLDVMILPTQPVAYLKVQNSHPEVQRINDILCHYGWMPDTSKTADGYDFFYFDGDISPD